MKRTDFGKGGSPPLWPLHVGLTFFWLLSKDNLHVSPSSFLSFCFVKNDDLKSVLSYGGKLGKTKAS